MKIEVTTLSRIPQKYGTLYIKVETIRVPSNVKNLCLKTVKEIMEDRVRRRKILIEYWKGKPGNDNDGRDCPIEEGSNRVTLSWSPIITTDALNFICEKF